MWADRVNDVLYLRPLQDPALSDEQRESQRLEIEWKYGLLAAQRADEAIEIYHRARANAQSSKKVVDRIGVQHKHALEEVEEARRALKKAKLQAERLDKIAAEESRAHKSAWDGYQKAKARANESFAEYTSKAVQQGVDEAVGVSYRRY
jgi:predicted ATPase